MIQYIDGNKLKDMFISGANNLQNNKETIDKLNVFPVPDGDTGTNMSLTISYAVKELEKVVDGDLSKVGKAISRGSLMGARGNSGVILSQIIRGFSISIEGKKKLSTDDIAKAIKNGADTAYKAVIKPIEGTILTVIRESGEYAVKLAHREKDIKNFFSMLVKEANMSVNRTPELLKNLKDAGVVDSGGKGLVCIYEGMYECIRSNKMIELSSESEKLKPIEHSQLQTISTSDIKYQYCTEFILESNKVKDTTIRDLMLKYGDSLAVFEDEGIIKVHVHTNEPGSVLQEALKYGQLLTIKVENMKLQHENLIMQESKKQEETKNEDKHYGFIVTSMGRGIADVFKGFGVDQIIEGGQTMNPSTEDFIKAIENIKAKDIYILPNNGNIIMAANQAKELSDKNIVVIPTKNVPQGFSALVAFNGELGIEENEKAMRETINSIKSGQVTFAVRDTVMDDIKVKEGNIIGLCDDGLVSAGEDVEKTTLDLIEKLEDEDSDVITLFYGEDVTESQANDLVKKLEEKYTGVSIEAYYGGQPLYYYLVSIE